tara:strand:+ start:240 stop:740 length:501 start_codon:yes stop_codon:yes gene_type:complete
MKKDSLIMNSKRINDCAHRISYQIVESSTNRKEIILIGIKNNGFIFAQKIHDFLKKITDRKIELLSVEINKKNHHKSITLKNQFNNIDNSSVILIDDVLNTGKTLMYTIKFLLNYKINQLKTAVLIDRNHKDFPVKVDFKGLSLSTSVNEHVEVVLKKNNEGVFLT